MSPPEVTTRAPSELTAADSARPSMSRDTRRWLVLASQSVVVLGPCTFREVMTTTRAPSGLNAAYDTVDSGSWGPSSARSFPVRALQILALLSQHREHPVTTREPSGLNDADV